MIQIWCNSDVSSFFKALNELPDTKMFTTVTELSVIVHEDVIQMGGIETSDTARNIEDFIGKFQRLRSLDSYPRDGFNPFAKVNTETLTSLTITTPCTKADMDIVSAFISSSQIQRLALRGMQAEQLSYEKASKLSFILSKV